MPPARLELATPGLGNLCSIQMSYGGVKVTTSHVKSLGKNYTCFQGECKVGFILAIITPYEYGDRKETGFKD